MSNRGGISGMTTKGGKLFWYIVMILPAVLVYLAVVAFPTVFSVYLSFTNYNGGKIFGEGSVDISIVGFDKYKWMFTESTGNFYTSLKNNLLIVAVSVFGQIPLGFILAYILSQKLIPFGSSFFQTMIYLPNIISAIVIGVLFNAFISGSNSVWMDIKKLFNPETTFHVSANPMTPVLVVILWMFTGFYMIIFMANIQRIDPTILEAARIDGAKENQILYHVVLPSMTGVIVTSAILAISGSLKTFDLIYAMTAGGPAGKTRVLSLYMYQSAFSGFPDYPLANAISTVMVFISIVLIILTRALGKVFDEKE
jgi:raffinose/stachyose/melibiose transport system permease protein